MSDGPGAAGYEKLKAEGKLADQEESDEINACSIVVPVEVDGKTEEWLVNFKNETSQSSHWRLSLSEAQPPVLGARSAIPSRDAPYVYQAMRVTGAADPTVSVKDTMEGKLPQKSW